jgi:hypothetical protein
MGKWLISLALLPALASPCAARTANREVKIHNVDSVSIYYLYATNAEVEGWGEDWLGEDVIIEDEVMRFDFDDGSGACTFDIKVQYADEAEAELYAVDVCTVSHIDARRSAMVLTDD